mmetsp:Transcript_17513/g.38294  ORF Transcript_17513/g.38294 Transcript_17513/m.38294 type:complete len:195 (+) Transcript_17513:166-750(+)
MTSPLRLLLQVRKAAFWFLVLLCCCHGFSMPNTNASGFPPSHDNDNGHSPKTTNYSLPCTIEDWDHEHVEEWLQFSGFGRYIPDFCSDFDGIGVDGDRLVYLGTEDQLDHIEYQLELIGVENESDQLVLGSAIIELVAVSSGGVTPEFLESLAKKIPIENRDKQEEEKQDVDDTNFLECGGDASSVSESMDYEI